jgi:hypothetical protein
MKKDADSIEIKLTPTERDLILEHTFAGNDLTDRIKLALLKGKHISAGYTLEELDELVGFIAAEANHSEDRKLERQLDRLFEKLSRVIEDNND